MLSLNTTSKTLKEYLKRFKKTMMKPKNAVKLNFPKISKKAAGLHK